MSGVLKTVGVAKGTQGDNAAAAISGLSSELIRVSGQPGTTADGKVPSDYVSQIHLAFLNMRKILLAAGSSVDSIVKLTVYIVDYDPENPLHTRPLQRFFGSHRPELTFVSVPKLAVEGWLFEVEAVVAKDNTPPPGKASSISIPSAPTETDVVVIGAGLAGLTAAHELRKSGLSCVVLEARDRVGGRTFNGQLSSGDGVVDLGAAWINDTNQERMIALARKYGARLVEQNTTGDCILQDSDGKLDRFPYGALPNFDEATKRNIAFIRDITEHDCQQVSCRAPKGPDLDSITFAAYLKRRGATDAAMHTATVWTRAMLGHEPEDISALFYLNYCKSGGGLLQMRSDRRGGGQHLRMRQGTQYISHCLAQDLPAGVLHLEATVTAISRGSRDSMIVRTPGRIFKASKVIVTAPPPVMKTIAFDPPLPLEKRLLYESYSYGYYQKVMAVFKKPFWIEKGFCGLSQSFIGPAAVVRDTSVPGDGKWILTCFMAGAPARAWSQLVEAERKRLLLEQLETVFEEPTARQLLVELVTHEWPRDEFAGQGCPSPALPPGVLDTVGYALRQPCSGIHFAGTETAEEWKGYMEGAVRSGERAAAEVAELVQPKGTIAKL